MGVGRRSLRTERVSRFEWGGADRMNRFCRYNLVCCPLQVLLAVKLAEKVSGDVVLGGADRMYWFYRYSFVFCSLQVCRRQT